MVTNIFFKKPEFKYKLKFISIILNRYKLYYLFFKKLNLYDIREFKNFFYYYWIEVQHIFCMEKLREIKTFLNYMRFVKKLKRKMLKIKSPYLSISTRKKKFFIDYLDPKADWSYEYNPIYPFLLRDHAIRIKNNRLRSRKYARRTHYKKCFLKKFKNLILRSLPRNPRIYRFNKRWIKKNFRYFRRANRKNYSLFIKYLKILNKHRKLKKKLRKIKKIKKISLFKMERFFRKFGWYINFNVFSFKEFKKSNMFEDYSKNVKSKNKKIVNFSSLIKAKSKNKKINKQISAPVLITHKYFNIWQFPYIGLTVSIIHNEKKLKEYYNKNYSLTTAKNIINYINNPNNIKFHDKETGLYFLERSFKKCIYKPLSIGFGKWHYKSFMYEENYKNIKELTPEEWEIKRIRCYKVNEKDFMKIYFILFKNIFSKIPFIKIKLNTLKNFIKKIILRDYINRGLKKKLKDNYRLNKRFYYVDFCKLETYYKESLEYYKEWTDHLYRKDYIYEAKESIWSILKNKFSYLGNVGPKYCYWWYNNKLELTCYYINWKKTIIKNNRKNLVDLYELRNHNLVLLLKSFAIFFNRKTKKVVIFNIFRKYITQALYPPIFQKLRLVRFDRKINDYNFLSAIYNYCKNNQTISIFNNMKNIKNNINYKLQKRFVIYDLFTFFFYWSVYYVSFFFKFYHITNLMFERGFWYYI